MVSLTGAQVPLTGAQYDLSAGDFRATVTELGAGLRRLEHRGQPVIVGYEPDMLPPGAAGQLLCPWPNRVDGGHYAIDGAHNQLDLSEPANENAIHGLTRWSSWTPGPAAAAEDEVTLRLVLLGHQGYPFCLELDASYRLDADHGLEVSISARNVGSAAAPYGTGSHPYLTAGTATVDECELELPARLRQPIGERGIPYDTPEDVTGTEFDFRAAKRIGLTQLDDALTGLTREADGRVRARLSGAGTQVTLWAGPGYEWLQVFTGDTLDPSHRRKAVAIEPMTCPPNAFVSGVDLLMLEPGDSVIHTWGIEVTPT
ncbi:MAG TPA: aldose 1-epimerase family protein [Streptosporangiaceae bacterium]|nr:aldose 1-epimerase family protein [Streptosporangiaceae bacterium]